MIQKTGNMFFRSVHLCTVVWAAFGSSLFAMDAKDETKSIDMLSAPDRITWPSTDSVELKDGLATVVATKSWQLIYKPKEDMAPANSLITLAFDIKREGQGQGRGAVMITARGKGDSRIFLKKDFVASGRKRRVTWSFLWQYPLEELEREAQVGLWMRTAPEGRYEISNVTYSFHEKIQGTTTTPLLEGSIKLDNPNIKVTGVRYVRKYPTHIELDRFKEECYAKDSLEKLSFSTVNARTTTGAQLVINTESPKVTLSWGLEPEYAGQRLNFGLYLNKKPTGQIFEKKRADLKQEFTFSFETGATKGKPVICEVIYPSHANPFLVGLKLEPGYELLPVPERNKKVFLALGDSITHGTGQTSTDKTWAFLLSKKNHLELFNMAVGGGQLAGNLLTAEQLGDWKKLDLITILVGANDYGSGKSPGFYYEHYKKMISTIRKTHPDTKIVCIAPTFSNGTEPHKKSGATRDQFRNKVAQIVAEAKESGDKNIYLVRGQDLTGPETGSLHFTDDGASIFADRLQLELDKMGIFK